MFFITDTYRQNEFAFRALTVTTWHQKAHRKTFDFHLTSVFSRNYSRLVTKGIQRRTFGDF